MNMEEKLELRHLAPYLPYKLQFITESDKHQGAWEMIGLRTNHDYPNEPTILSYRKDYGNTINIWSRTAKPLLHPLSRLIEPILEDGGIPLFKLVESFGHSLGHLSDEGLQIAKKRLLNDILTQNLPFKYFQKLIEWKLDVFNLIPKGLALPIAPK